MVILLDDFNSFFSSLSTQDAAEPNDRTVKFFSRYESTDVAKQSATILEKCLIIHVESVKEELLNFLGNKTSDIVHYFNRSVKSQYSSVPPIKFSTIKELSQKLPILIQSYTKEQTAIFVIAGLLKLMDDLGLSRLKPWMLKRGLLALRKSNIDEPDFKNKMMILYLNIINQPLKYLAYFLIGVSVIVRLPHVVEHAKKSGAKFYDKLVTFITKMKELAEKTGFPKLRFYKWETIVNAVNRHKSTLVPIEV